MSIVVYPTGTNYDFDVFVSTSSGNKLPSSSNHNYSGIRGSGRAEFVVVPASTQQRTIYIAVGAFLGEGQFRFYANVDGTTTSGGGYPQTLDIMTDWATSPTHKAQIRKQIHKLAQSLYWVTDGRHRVKYANIYWNHSGPLTQKPYFVWSGYDCGANQCISNCPSIGDHISIHPWSWCNTGCYPGQNPSCACADTQSVNEGIGVVGAHEAGHCFFSLCPNENEYPNGCGHSLMMGGLSFSSLNMVDFCDSNNGGENPPAGTGSHSTSVDNWPIIENNYPSSPSYPTNYTPDPFFAAHDNTLNDIFQVTLTEY